MKMQNLLMFLIGVLPSLWVESTLYTTWTNNSFPELSLLLMCAVISPLIFGKISNLGAGVRTVRYTNIPKISVLNQYRYIDTGYSTITIYWNFGYTGIFRYIVLYLPTIWRNHNLYFTTEWQFRELSTAMI
jgi:hypothetical protein